MWKLLDDWKLKQDWVLNCPECVIVEIQGKTGYINWRKSPEVFLITLGHHSSPNSVRQSLGNEDEEKQLLTVV